MAKLTRQIQSIFGADGPVDEFGQIGSFAGGDPTKTKDLDVMQQRPEYLDGLFGITEAGTNRPLIEDINSMYFMVTRQLAYMFEAGIPEWHQGTQYYANTSWVTVGNSLYRAKLDNINESPPSATYWDEMLDQPVNDSADVTFETVQVADTILVGGLASLAGGANITGDLSAGVALFGTGATSNGERLSVKRDATIGPGTSPNLDNATIRIEDNLYSLYVDGNSILTDGPMYIGSVSDRVTIGSIATEVATFREDEIEFQVPASLADGADITGTLDVSGAVDFASSLLVEGAAEFGDQIQVDGIVLVGTGATSNGERLSVKRNATIGNITSPTLDNATIRIEDAAYSLYVDGNSIFTNGPLLLAATAHAVTIGSIGIEVAIFEEDEITFQVPASLAGGANITGTLDVSEAVDFASSLLVGGLASLAGGANITGTLDVSGAVDFASSLLVEGAAEFGDQIQVDGIATFSADVEIVADLEVTGTTKLQGVQIGASGGPVANVSVFGDVSIFSVGGNGGDLTLVGEITATGSGTFTLGNLNNGATFNIWGDVSIGQSLGEAGGNLSADVALFGTGATSNGERLSVKRNATIGNIASPTLDNATIRVEDNAYNLYVDGNSIFTNGPLFLASTTNTVIIGSIETEVAIFEEDEITFQVPASLAGGANITGDLSADVALFGTGATSNGERLSVKRDATIGPGTSPNLDNATIRIEDNLYSLYVDGNSILTDGPMYIGSVSDRVTIGSIATEVATFEEDEITFQVDVDASGFVKRAPVLIGTGTKTEDQWFDLIVAACKVSVDADAYINIIGKRLEWGEPILHAELITTGALRFVLYWWSAPLENIEELAIRDGNATNQELELWLH